MSIAGNRETHETKVLCSSHDRLVAGILAGPNYSISVAMVSISGLQISGVMTMQYVDMYVNH